MSFRAWKVVRVMNQRLRRRHNIKRLRNFLLPSRTVLAVYFSSRLEALTALVKKSSAKNDRIGAHGFLMVVHVGGAIGAIIAVDVLTYKES